MKADKDSPDLVDSIRDIKIVVGISNKNGMN